MQVMLPILKTSGATNLTRNDFTKKKLTQNAKAKLNEQIIHTPAELTDFSIHKQFGMETKRYSLAPSQGSSPSNKDQFDEWEKRVTFTDLARKARGPRQLGAAAVSQSARREERAAQLQA